MSQHQNFTEERLFGERETTKYDKEHRKNSKTKQTEQTAKTNKNKMHFYEMICKQTMRL